MLFTFYAQSVNKATSYLHFRGKHLPQHLHRLLQIALPRRDVDARCIQVAMPQKRSDFFYAL